MLLESADKARVFHCRGLGRGCPNVENLPHLGLVFEFLKSAIDPGNHSGLQRHNVTWVFLGVTPTKSKVGDMWALAGC